MSQRKALIASILLTLVLAFSAIGIRAAMFDSPDESASTKGALPLLVDDRRDDDRYEDDDEDDRYEHDDDGKAYASSYRDDEDDDRYEHEDDDDDDD
jgi:hypothetical protein